MAGEAGVIRIGATGTHTRTFVAGISGSAVPNGVSVIVGTGGKLGTVVSSARFKDDIKPMNEASETIFSLKPVSFHYKPDLDPDRIPQFGLVAEEVAKINPDLVVPDEAGKAYTVRYEAVNAMLLNEFLKEHRRFEEQAAKVRKQETAIAEQQKAITALGSQLQEQALQLQKVSARLAAVDQSAPRVAANDQTTK